MQETVKTQSSRGNDSLSCVQSSISFLDDFESSTLPKVLKRIEDLERSGNAIVSDMPVHATTVEMGLTHLRERWEELNRAAREGREKLLSAQEFYRLLDQSEKFLSEANQHLLGWSRRISTLDSSREALGMKGEIEKYIKDNKSAQNER